SSSTPAAPRQAIGDDASAADASPQADATVAPDASDAGGEPGEAAADASDDGAADGAADVATPAEASADAAPDAAPDTAAGAGCLSPGTEPPLSAASAGLPADGLALWVRADRGVYMTAQSEVCAWKDQSGNDRLLSAASTRPIWQGASVGGMPAIHFSAVGTDLYTPDLLGIGA